MTAKEFETAAIQAGLKMGFRHDFQWVESCDEKKWCSLISKGAIEFAKKNSIEFELTLGGYLAYFTS